MKCDRLQTQISLGQHEAILQLCLRIYVGDLVAEEEG